MTFQQLQYLLEINKTGSITTAANNLYVTQSSVSNALAALEKEVGVPIFVRGKKGLYPTPRGEEIIAHAGRICDSYQFLISNNIAETNCLRICCDTYTPANDAFLRLLKEAADPDVQYSFVNHKYMDSFQALVNYELDIAIHLIYTPNKATFLSKAKKFGLNCEEIAEVPVAVCIGPGHRLYHKEDIQMEDLQEDRILELPTKNNITAENLGAFIPINKDNILIASGTVLRERLLEQGYVYSLRSIPTKTRRA
ncbi:MAG: LysR family transcriptional regulator, partial [Oscillospiraceae bacterium]|nr:LysR family transcriptional regulator [Oscillospiraceae bacterium]